VTFLSAVLAGLTAAIVVPTLIILYFLKLRRRDLDISTTLLWKKSIQDLQANAPFQKLRRNLLLFLQLLVLAALLFAIAQPLIKGQSFEGQRHVILIDRSGSMSSLDAGDDPDRPIARLDQAKKQAIALVESMKEGDKFFGASAGDSAMVIAFDNQAEPLQPFTSDKRLLRKAIEAITPTDKTSAIEEAMRVALAHLPRRVLFDDKTGKEYQLEGLTSGEAVNIQLYTDGKLPDQSRAQPGTSNTIVYHQVGSVDAPNVGVFTLKAERSYENPAEVTIFASILNTAQAPRQIDAELLIDGAVAGIRSVSLPAAGKGNALLSPIGEARARASEREAAQATGAEATTTQSQRPGVAGVTFKLERTDGLLVQVRLREAGQGQPPTSNVLAADDRAWLVIPPAKRTSVAIVSKGAKANLFLQSALEGMPLARVDTMSETDFAKAWKEGRAGVWDVVILDNVIPDVGQELIVAAPAPPAPTTPADPKAPAPPTPPPPAPKPTTRTLPPGNYLVFGQVPSGFGLIDKGPQGQASFIDWSRDHPATRYLVLDPVRITTFRQVVVEPGTASVSLASAERGPGIVEVSKGDTHALVVPFDYMESSWPVDLSFVVFLASSLTYLGEEVGGRLDARALQPGRELKDRLPLGAADATVRDPEGRASTLTPSQDGTIIHRVGPTTGVYEVTWDGPTAPGDVRNDRGRALRVFASNLLDASESDVPAAPQLALASTNVAASTERSTKSDLRLWPYLLLLGLAIVMLEWYIYNRKVYV
jgi:hypothetical protein